METFIQPNVTAEDVARFVWNESSVNYRGCADAARRGAGDVAWHSLAGFAARDYRETRGIARESVSARGMKFLAEILKRDFTEMCEEIESQRGVQKKYVWH